MLPEWYVSHPNPANILKIEVVFIQVLRLVLASVISSAGDPDVEDIAMPFMEGICRHFALLYAAGVSDLKQKHLNSQDDKSSRDSALKFSDPGTFLDALILVKISTSPVAGKLKT